MWPTGQRVTAHTWSTAHCSDSSAVALEYAMAAADFSISATSAMLSSSPAPAVRLLPRSRPKDPPGGRPLRHHGTPPGRILLGDSTPTRDRRAASTRVLPARSEPGSEPG